MHGLSRGGLPSLSASAACRIPFSFGKGDVNLGAPFAVYEHKRRHNREAYLLSSFLKFVYLVLGKQQLAVALGLVVIVGTEKYGDMFMPFTQISPLCI